MRNKLGWAALLLAVIAIGILGYWRSGFEKYNNETTGFSFFYPKGLLVEEEQGVNTLGEKQFLVKMENGAGYGAMIWIGYLSLEGTMGPDEPKQVKETSEITLDGITGEKTVRTTETPGGPATDVTINVTKGDTWYFGSFDYTTEEDKKITNTILRTIDFTPR